VVGRRTGAGMAGGRTVLRLYSRLTDPKGFGLSSYAVPLSRV
jgi:hypothetical protein